MVVKYLKNNNNYKLLRFRWTILVMGQFRFVTTPIWVRFENRSHDVDSLVEKQQTIHFTHVAALKYISLFIYLLLHNNNYFGKLLLPSIYLAKPTILCNWGSLLLFFSSLFRKLMSLLLESTFIWNTM